VSLSSALPWESVEEVDPVPPPPSAYAEEPPPLDLEPPPPPPPPPFAPAAPSYESYVVEEPAPPFADGIDVPNAPPELATVAPAHVITKRPNWIMRHKLVAATTAVVSAVIVAAAVNSTGDPGTPTLAPTSSAGIQLSPSGGSTDQEVPVGTAATIGGMQATVTAANFQQTLDENRIDGYLVVDVAYANTSGQNKPYNSLDWKLRSPSGTTTGSEAGGMDGQLAAGDLAAGGTVAGKLAFKVGAEKGEFAILWKPDPVDPSQGVWKAPVS